VLTREFKVLGFGAKFDARINMAETSPRRFKHIASGELYDDKTFMSAIGGTRHQSAARLCQIHSGIMVLTLSQDSDLKLFVS
jgi:DNA integrity scanning protein DisA with diadenylate cyclase activity